MTSKIYKTIAIVLIFAFFITAPLFQSFIFSSNTQGAIKIDKEIDMDFIKSDKKIVLIFFGYVGCADICTPILEKFSTLYNSREFDNFRNEIDVYFVNLKPEIEVFQADLFAKYFNDDFKGVYLSRRELLNIDRTFGLFFSKDLNNETELNHTDYIYLIHNSKEKKLLKSIYSNHPLNNQKLISDIISLQSKL